MELICLQYPLLNDRYDHIFTGKKGHKIWLEKLTVNNDNKDNKW